MVGTHGRTKNGEALGHWVAGGPLVQVQKGQQNKNVE